MAELHCFPGPGERDPAAILETAKRRNPRAVIVLLIDENGEFRFSTSYGEWPEIAMMMKRADWFIQRESE